MKTISRKELERRVFCNKRVPKFINDNGTRKEWIGIGWFPLTVLPKETDVVVTDVGETK